MEAPVWTYEHVDTITGDRLGEIEVQDASWQLRLSSQIGTGSVTIATKSAFYDGWSSSDWERLRRSWATTIVGKFNDVPVWGHVVTGKPAYQHRTGRLTLPTAELGELLKRRLFFGAGLLGQGLTLGPYSRLGMLNAVARHVCGGGAGTPPSGSISPWRLPVWIEVPQAGGWNRTTMQHEFARPWNWMTEIAEGGNGLDFVFAPGFWGDGDEGLSDRAFQWVMHSGPSLERSVHEYDLDAPGSPIGDALTLWDAEEQQTGVFVPGDGYGSARPVGMAVPSDSMVMPAMDIAVPSVRQSSKSSLDEEAAALLDRFRNPITVTPFDVDAGVALAPMHGGVGDGLRPGSRVVLHTDNPVVGAVTEELRVVGMSGRHGSRSVSVEVQRV